jgi:hypothetical protein
MPVARGAILLRQGETRTRFTKVTRSHGQGDCGRAQRTQPALSSVVGCTWQLECVATRMDRYEYGLLYVRLGLDCPETRAATVCKGLCTHVPIIRAG